MKRILTVVETLKKQAREQAARLESQKHTMNGYTSLIHPRDINPKIGSDEHP